MYFDKVTMKATPVCILNKWFTVLVTDPRVHQQ